jgi:predicted RNA-binding Zn-ribbon protein involved in translation (DUF1610 family)
MNHYLQPMEWYEAHQLNLENAPDLLPYGEQTPQARPSSVWSDNKNGYVAWRMEEGDWLRMPVGKDGIVQSIEACFPAFLKLANASTSEEIAAFVEEWGALQLYPQDCTLEDGSSAKCEAIALYINHARWCAAVMNIATDLSDNQSGKRADWERIYPEGRSTPPPYECSIEQQDNMLLWAVSIALSKSGITPSVQRVNGQIRVMASRLACALQQRSWDKAQEEGKPAVDSTLHGDIIRFRPSEMWAAIMWRLTSILATPAGLGRCVDCHHTFPRNHRSQKYCPECGEKSKRGRKRVAAHRARQKRQ